MTYNNNFEREFGWDDTIQEDSKDFITLTPGDYVFTVTNFERGRHTPNPQNPGKLPACNKAIITLQVETDEGLTTMTHNLFLHSSTEGMLSAFFGAIGQKKHGEPLQMNWNTVVGSTGVCRVGNRTYKDNVYNDVKQMIYADSVDWTKVLNANQAQNQPQAPSYQASSYQAPSYQAPSYQAPQGQVPQGQVPPQPQAPQQPMQPQHPVANGGFGGF